jgi:hypothetical protein
MSSHNYNRNYWQPYSQPYPQQPPQNQYPPYGYPPQNPQDPYRHPPQSPQDLYAHAPHTPVYGHYNPSLYPPPVHNHYQQQPQAPPPQQQHPPYPHGAHHLRSPEHQRYVDPRSPMQTAFDPAVAFPTISPNEPYGMNEYMQMPEISQLNLDEQRPGRLPEAQGPQYIGRRARSRAPSKPGTRPASQVEQKAPSSRSKQIWPPPPPPPGYKPPYVESVPTTPVLRASLPSDSGSVFEDNTEYLEKHPPEPYVYIPVPSPEEVRKSRRKEAPPPLTPQEPEDRVPLERIRTPYTNSTSSAASTTTSSSSPEMLPLERERRQYSNAANNAYPQQPQYTPPPRADSPMEEIVLERERRQYTSGPTVAPAPSKVPRKDSVRRKKAPQYTPPQEEITLERERRGYSSGGYVSGSASNRRDSDRRDSVELERERHPYHHDARHDDMHDFPPEMSRQSTPYASHRDPPPETPRQSQPYSSTPNLPPEMTRQSTPYASAPIRDPPPEMSRQSQPYSSTSSAPAKKSTGYSSSAADLAYSREDMRAPTSAHSSPRAPVPPSPRQPRPTQSPGYSPILENRSTQASASSYMSTPAVSVPSPTTSQREAAFEQSLQARPKTPQSEFINLVAACPRRKLVSEGTWYAVPSIPDYHVCERCFELNIYDSPFARFFQEIHLGPGRKTFCYFNCPRVMRFVWPKTIEHNLWTIFEGYARDRIKFGPCTASDGSAKKGIWYTLRDNPASGFISCEACYEDIIKASPHHFLFKAINANVDENTVSCHIAWPFIEARILGKPENWADTYHDIDFRIHGCPPCPIDKYVPATTRRWWKPKNFSLPIHVCDCCFLDGVYPGGFYKEFEEAKPSRKDEVRCCAMSAHQLSTAWSHAMEDAKTCMTVWKEAATHALSPPCDINGSKGNTWWVFRDPDLDGFDFCERCVGIFIKPLGFGSKMEKRMYQDQEIMKCDLNPGNSYSPMLIQKLTEAAAWRSFDIIKNHLMEIAPVVHPIIHDLPARTPTPPLPPCPKDKEAHMDVWYSHNKNTNFVICEECFHNFILDSQFGNDFHEYQASHKEYCDFGDPRILDIWGKVLSRKGKSAIDLFFNVLGQSHQIKNLREDFQDLTAKINSNSRVMSEGQLHALELEAEDIIAHERELTNELAIFVEQNLPDGGSKRRR